MKSGKLDWLFGESSSRYDRPGWGAVLLDVHPAVAVVCAGGEGAAPGPGCTVPALLLADGEAWQLLGFFRCSVGAEALGVSQPGCAGSISLARECLPGSSVANCSLILLSLN